ncbi:GNAT family N-acetyltransferase [Spirillospora sp. NPDC050679]
MAIGSRPSTGATSPVVSLRGLTPAAADGVEHWFDHPEVDHWLGGRSWIHRELRLRLAAPPPGGASRDTTVPRSHAWIALDEARTPVAYIGGDVEDRPTRSEGPNGPVPCVAGPSPSMSLAYVVDPARWRQGYGRATIIAALTCPEIADVQTFYCGIDTGNRASQRCVTAAGFRLLDPVPDFEDTLYYSRTR